MVELLYGTPGTIQLPRAARASSAVGVTVRSERLRPDAGALAEPCWTKSGGGAMTPRPTLPRVATPRRRRRLASVVSAHRPVRFGAILRSFSLVTRASARRERLDSSRHPVVAVWDAVASARHHVMRSRRRALERRRSPGTDRSSFVAYRRVRSAYRSISRSDDRFSALRRWKDDPTGNYPPSADRPRVVAVSSRHERPASASRCTPLASASRCTTRSSTSCGAGRRDGVPRRQSKRVDRPGASARPDAATNRDRRRTRRYESASRRTGERGKRAAPDRFRPSSSTRPLSSAGDPAGCRAC